MPKCNCKLKSGKACSYNAKSGSLYCGKHDSCSNRLKSPKRKSPCPSEKELNPRTSRCVKKCSPQHTRNTSTGRCVKLHKKNQSVQKMYPICLLFVVTIYDSLETVNPSTLTKNAKALFRDGIENNFVQRLENVSGIRITDIKLAFTNDSSIIMRGLIPIPSNDKRLLYGATLSNWIEAINEKSIWQTKFGPNKDDFVESNEKEYKFDSVHQCDLE
jgi:hypothetical protein